MKFEQHEPCNRLVPEICSLDGSLPNKTTTGYKIKLTEDGILFHSQLEPVSYWFEENV
jgi:hypothetical protein